MVESWNGIQMVENGQRLLKMSENGLKQVEMSGIAWEYL